MILASRTTTIRYSKKPQAAVQYEIVLSKGTLTYNPNESENIKGSLEWIVYRVEGSERKPMSYNAANMVCRCGYTDSPTASAGNDGNITFNDNGTASVKYNAESTKSFTITYGIKNGTVVTILARKDVPVNVIGKDSTPTLSVHLDNQYDTMLCYYHDGNTVYYGSKPITNVSVIYGGEDVTDKTECTVTVSATPSALFSGEWLTAKRQYRVNKIAADTLVTFTAAYKGQTVKSVMTVRLQDGGNKYNLRLSPSIITLNATTGVMTDDEVEVEVWMENETGMSNLKSLPQDMSLSYNIDGGASVDIIDYAGTYVIPVSETARKITVTLASGQEGTLDTQSVSVVEVENGNEGEPGKDAPSLEITSPSCIVRLSDDTYGTPVVSSTNMAELYLGGVRQSDTYYWFATVTDSFKLNVGDTKTLIFNGWKFDVSNSNGSLTFALVEVAEGGIEVISLPIVAFSEASGTFGNKNVSYAISRKGDPTVSVDFDNNNASILYNSSKGEFMNSPVSKVSVFVGGMDISETATVKITSHNLTARVTGRGGINVPLTPGTSVSVSNNYGNGAVAVTVTAIPEDVSAGYITATYVDDSGGSHSATFNVYRSVGRYTAEINATPTQVSYNMTTGVASSDSVNVTLSVIDINGAMVSLAKFSDYGAMKYRYIGDATWREPSSQNASSLSVTSIDWTKKGLEFAFIDGNGVQLDFETVPFASVTNGGDAYLVNAASTNIALSLSAISYGNPTGDVVNVIYMTKNNNVISSGMQYNVPGEDGDEHTLSDDVTSVTNVSYNGWVFNYSYSEGKLTSRLVKVLEGSPTGIQVLIDVIDTTDNITRQIMVSYTAIQKGPAGRSYRPNSPELYNANKEGGYKWNDEYRDFIYYPFKVNADNEVSENGEVKYFVYGVKEYNPEASISNPPSAPGGDAEWEYVSEHKTIITNCLFGTNAVIGGFVMSNGIMESVMTTESQRENEKGEVETYTRPMMVLDGNASVFEMFNGKAGIRIALDEEGQPCITGYNADGKCVWKLGSEVVTDYNDNVDIEIPYGSTVATANAVGSTLTIAVRGVWRVTNNTNNPITFTRSSLVGYFGNPLESGEVKMTIPASKTLAVGESANIVFQGSYAKNYGSAALVPVTDGVRINVKAYYMNKLKAMSSVAINGGTNIRI